MAKAEGKSKDIALGVDAAVAQISAKYGVGAIQRMSERPVQLLPVYSTGLLDLDIILGVGGLGQGRVIEMIGPESSGKTTLAIQCIAQAQATHPDLMAAFIDAEHSLDPIYAQGLGVKWDQLLISQPDYGEQALEIALFLAKAGGVSVIVIDSVAALTPKVEIEGEVGATHMGAQARMMSQGLRMLVGVAQKSNTTIIFINQIREKIGVMFGCLRGDTVIPFVDGTSATIAQTVQQRLDKEIWAFDAETNTIRPARIVNWFHNGHIKPDTRMIHITANGIGTKNGLQGMYLTPEHKVLTNTGHWIEAQKLDPNKHQLVSKIDSIINGSLASFLYGTCLGDGHLTGSHQPAALRFQDRKNIDYINWKSDLLQPWLKFSESDTTHTDDQKPILKLTSQFRADLGVLRDRLGRGLRTPSTVIEDPYFNDMSLALWYMDDGCLARTGRATLSVKRFKNHPELDRIVAGLAKMGYNCSARSNDGCITFSASSTRRLFERIAQWVPSSMQYKLDAAYQGRYVPFTLTAEYRTVSHSIHIKEITETTGPKGHKAGAQDLYDLQIEGLSNYMSGNAQVGFIVHNSPETTPGGRALRFYASVRLDIRKKEPIKIGTEQVGNYVQIKTIKNKTAPPYKMTLLPLMYGAGISRSRACIEGALAMGVLEQDGSHLFKFRGKALAKGKPAMDNYLDDHPVQRAYIERVSVNVATTGEAIPDADLPDEVDASVVVPAVSELEDDDGASRGYTDDDVPSDPVFLIRDALVACSGQALEIHQIAAAVDLDEITIAKTCAKMVNKGLVHSPKPGLWAALND